MGEWETLREIVAKRRSIARGGDGEWKIARGASIKSQDADPELARRIREVLRSDDERLLVGIPNIWSGVRLPHDKARFWAAWRNDRLTGLLEPGKLYWSAFITRPDSAPDIGGEDYWQLMRSAWSGRQALLVTGSGKGQRFLAMMDNAERADLQLAPRQNAWARYGEILTSCLDWFAQAPDGVAILSLGPTATVLAHDLAARGCQALDLGHAACFAAKQSPKELIDEA